VFRRPGGRFFGKILKLVPTVTLPPFAKLPRWPRRPLAAGRLATLAAVLPAALGAFAPAAGGRAAADPGPAASVYGRGPRPAIAAEAGQPVGADAAAAVPPDAAERAVQAERIVASSLATLARVESFSARLRQKARLGDRVLVGTGRYLQTGQGESQKFRFESTLESDSESFELLELSDGLFAWAYRRDGPQPPTLYRIDVRRVHDRLVELGCPTPEDTARYLGGLQRSLGLIRQWMHFTSADPQEIDGTSVWMVDGSWAPGALAATGPPLHDKVVAGAAIVPADLPDGVPWSVRLAIGRGDLVPRRIEWLAIPGPRPVSPDAPLEPIAILEVFDIVIDGFIEPATFFYQPAITGLMDVTDQHVKTLALFRP